MTREESWQVEGTTRTLLRHVTSLGHTVSVFRFPSSLQGKPGFVKMHARTQVLLGSAVVA